MLSCPRFQLTYTRFHHTLPSIGFPNLLWEEQDEELQFTLLAYRLSRGLCTNSRLLLKEDSLMKIEQGFDLQVYQTCIILNHVIDFFKTGCVLARVL